MHVLSPVLYALLQAAQSLKFIVHQIIADVHHNADYLRLNGDLRLLLFKEGDLLIAVAMLPPVLRTIAFPRFPVKTACCVPVAASR